MATRVVDKNKQIIELVWTGKETPADIEAANKELQALVAQVGGPFDLLVDMSTVFAWSQETKAAVIAHQKLLLSLGMRRASVVVGNAVARLQLNGLKRASLNAVETQWPTYNEALSFLRQPVSSV